MVKFIGKREVMNCHKQGLKDLFLSGDEIITQEAWEFARRLGIKFSRRLEELSLPRDEDD